MKGKSILAFFVAIFCFVVNTTAQDNKSEASSKAIVSIANTKGHYVQTDKTGKLIFTVTATEAQAKEIKEKIKGHVMYKLNMKKSDKNTYECELEVQFPDARGIARALGTMGFEEVDFNGQQKNLNELAMALNQIR